MKQLGWLPIRVEPIGIIRSGFIEKFGTPRQPGLVQSAVSLLELQEPYNRPEMVRGLELFSHIWLQFLFHETCREGWKPTVRPPRLGGVERVGVFASRSPHRPNHIGLSAVQLHQIRISGNQVTLEIGGADLLDGTPVLDIKPYLFQTDCLEGASQGWLPEEFERMAVAFSPEAESFCSQYEKDTGRDLGAILRETLGEDPRPASQRGKKHGFGMRLYDVNIRLVCRETDWLVTSCELLDQG
jgi:tRNA-Thr(GGU) m(6)t(6)A37 methyltransferase TsaA